MAVTLGLSQIVKDEEHVIERSLNSIKSIVDHLTIVDTGSEDNTIEVIKNWSKENNIPVDIYQREFDISKILEILLWKKQKGRLIIVFG